MKILDVMRHAKTEAWTYGCDDHARRLTGRGRKDARLVGALIVGSGQLPQDAVVSSATRTRQTFGELRTQGIAAPMRASESLYGASANGALSLIQDLDDGVDHAMVVGHEPTMGEIIRLFVGASGSNIHIPTAAVARVSFAAKTWESLYWGTGELEWFMRPKGLRPPAQ